MSDGEQTQHKLSTNIASTLPLRHIGVSAKVGRGRPGKKTPNGLKQFWSLWANKMSKQASFSSRARSIPLNALTKAYMQLQRLRQLVNEAESCAAGACRNVNSASGDFETSPPAKN